FIVNSLVMQSGGGITNSIGLGIFLGLVIFVCALAILVFISYWIMYTRKNLFNQLEKYKAGKPLPNRIVRNDFFVKYLKKEQANN
ncbi:MAG: hypothetical protein M3352_12105, partial [Bacteroidota bacterium]|nr:hypothetical protein [Bacteroidota bacterium]